MRSAQQQTVECIQDLIEIQARSSPQSTAILAPNRTPLTYSRLLAQTIAINRDLRRAGIGRTSRVAIVLPNGPDMAAAFLAVATAAVAAPLNPAYPEAEFDDLLSDLGASALLVMAADQSPAVAVARGRGIRVLELVPAAEAGAFSLTVPPDAPALEDGPGTPGDVALVLHTSGTTSRPKRVPLTHANLCASAANIRVSLHLTSADRCLNVMPLFHIHGLAAALLAPLAAGGSVVCTPGYSASEFSSWLAAFAPTWFTAVPTIYQAILADAAAGHEAAADHSLRFIRSCSAPLPPQLMASMEEAFGVPVVEAYGMTEAAHQLASNPLPPGRRKPGSAGVATGAEVTILGEDGCPLPPGKTGEVAVRGPNVMGGYEDNAAANRSAFAGEWFRTGDQGYLDGEGYLFITGRLKEVINRAGEKISPRKIDEVLLSHPDVAEAVAFAVPHARLGEAVAAAVVVREGSSATEHKVRRFAAQRLAHFEVPSRVLIVNEIPKGPTGKIQRVGLAEKLGLGEGSQGTPYVPPRNPIEKWVAGIWSEVLGVERISIHDEFIYLGGDSILATLAISRLRQGIGLEIDFQRFFEAPTVAGISALVGEMLLQESTEARGDAGTGESGGI